MAKNYMESLLGELRDSLDLYAEDPSVKACDEIVARMRAELVKSFKNGIMRGRELARDPKGRSSKSTGRTLTNRQRSVR